MSRAVLHCGDVRDVLATLPAESVQCVVTSPPYWGLRDYGADGQIGLEPAFGDYIGSMVSVFDLVKRVLRPDGTLWLNLGDCYHSGNRGGYRKDAHRWEKSKVQRGNRGNATTIRPNRLPQDGLKDKDLVGMPWRVALALQAAGWWLRADVIWHKPNPMPSSVTDRPTMSHEYVFLFAKSELYYYDSVAIAEPSTGRDAGNGFDRPHRIANGPGDPTPWISKGSTRNARSVWTITAGGYPGAHFATFPIELAARCIAAGSTPGDLVLDPFGGSGTVAAAATGMGRDSIYVDLNPEYRELARQRIGPMLCEDAA